RPCPGISTKLLKGQSPHSTYPFTLHDQFGDPWDYSVRRGILALFSPSCCDLKQGERMCEGCTALNDDKRLKGILIRANEGRQQFVGFVLES
ncbi:hypothetical protein BDP27DRAFT_1228389, partial [Rhodocollybia butyracea]